jgi:glutaredoxin
MSPFREPASLIWLGDLGWARHLAVQNLAANEQNRCVGQLGVIVYARARCVSSWRVKRLLRRKGYVSKVVDVSRYGKPSPRWRNSDGGKKAPQVFIDGRPVGGLRELTDLDRSDHLDRLMHGEI